MKTNIINTDKPNITDNEILQSKPSFNSIYSKFASLSGKMFFTKSMFYWASGLVVVSSIAALLILNTNKADDNNKIAVKNTTDSTKTKAYVEAPINDINIKYKSHNLNADRSSQISTCKGSKISIPENAFVYEDGTPVEGEVTLKYREFNNPVEIFRSGIPMTYDSAGTEYVFESAGMIELLAFKNDKSLKLAKGKTLEVALKSDNNEDRFNVYYLDTNKRNWVYEGRDICENIPKTKNENLTAKPVEKREVAIEEKIIEKETPRKEIIKPVLASKNATIFKVDYNTNDFPELSVYKSLLFEIADNSFKFNKDLYTVNWDNILLKRTNSKDLYTITLQKRDSIVSFTARPVFNKAQYEEAMRVYTEETKIEQKVRRPRAENQIAATTLTNSFVSGLGDKNTSTRTFEVNTMGIWNCDHPLPYTNFKYTASVVSFKDASNGQNINCKSIYVATLKANILLK